MGGAGWAPQTDVTFPYTATRAWETAVDIRQAVSLAHVLVGPGEPSPSRAELLSMHPNTSSIGRAAIPAAVAGLTQWQQQLGELARLALAGELGL